MKSYLLTIAALSLVITGFNIPVDAQDDFNHNQLKSSASLLANLAQNIVVLFITIIKRNLQILKWVKQHVEKK